MSEEGRKIVTPDQALDGIGRSGEGRRVSDEIVSSLALTPENRRAVEYELLHNPVAAAILQRSADLLLDARSEIERLRVVVEAARAATVYYRTYFGGDEEAVTLASIAHRDLILALDALSTGKPGAT
jgi:maltooligosyltrehalose synthase